eukprot:TRINITY_DN175_c0_g1_i13.p3 TRINITY_DN175_c0_g1~~TRINITY_DN175_c0_g1_i13.p3  ORF type:complete len:370 (+),score=206.28 TRINITY_DN175_c0_g1_i13:846-1955(+)
MSNRMRKKARIDETDNAATVVDNNTMSVDNNNNKEEEEEEGEEGEDSNKAEDKEHEEKLRKGQLTINRVAADVSSVRTQLQQLQATVESPNVADRKGLQREVERLQHASLGYTEMLMRDLLALDEVTGADELRPLRKTTVKEVQSLLDDVDGLRGRLADIHKSVLADLKEEEEKEKQRKEAEAEEEEAKQKQKEEEEDAAAAADDDDEPVEEDLDEESVDSVDWSTLKLDPEFHIAQSADAYTLTSYLPHLNEDDVSIELASDSELRVSGVVLPSREQAAQLWHTASMMKQRDARFASASVTDLALRGAAKRFGRFSSRFALPSDAIADDISGNLRRGYLRVRIPRRRVAPRYAPAFPQRQFRPPGLFW